VFAYDYRLAPEHPYPAALDDAMIAYEYLLNLGYTESNIVLCGDSAGGGLTIALTMVLRDRGRKLPAALMVISPWTDLTESGDSHYRNTDLDPLISSEELRNTALLYSGQEDLHNPYISPLYGDFTGFPPVLIHVGTNEVLLDDSTNLATRMEAQGVDVDIDVYEGMWHVWHMFDIPEAHVAIHKIKWFVHTSLEIHGLKKRVIRPGATYRHFKGKDYQVLYVARHSETLEEMVVYQQLYGERGIWVRPLDMFLETIERDGKLQYRFTEVDDPTI
jgi:acetyl esterase/lipase